MQISFTRAHKREREREVEDILSLHKRISSACVKEKKKHVWGEEKELK